MGETQDIPYIVILKKQDNEWCSTWVTNGQTDPNLLCFQLWYTNISTIYGFIYVVSSNVLVCIYIYLVKYNKGTPQLVSFRGEGKSPQDVLYRIQPITFTINMHGGLVGGAQQDVAIAMDKILVFVDHNLRSRLEIQSQ